MQYNLSIGKHALIFINLKILVSNVCLIRHRTETAACFNNFMFLLAMHTLPSNNMDKLFYSSIDKKIDALWFKEREEDPMLYNLL